MKKSTTVLLVTTLFVIVHTCRGARAQEQKQTIYEEDFEQNFAERADRWKGSAEHGLITGSNKVISGNASYQLSGGKAAVTNEHLKVTAGSKVDLEFDYRLTDQPEEGLIPHTEVRIVGRTKITPYLKINMSRQDHRYGRKSGKVYTARKEGFTFPYTDHVRLIFRCVGPGSMVVDNIRVVLREQPPPEKAPGDTPEIIYPDDGSKMSHPAMELRWKSTESARETGYTIQFARSKDFDDVVQREKSVNWRTSRKLTILPGENIKPGKWFWRVRAGNKHGQTGWSEVRSFVIAEPQPVQPPPYKTSSDKPLFILEGGIKRWKHIPDDLKPYVYLKLRGLRQFKKDLLDRCEEQGIPVLAFRFQPGPELERAFKNYDCLKGVVPAEAGAHGYDLSSYTKNTTSRTIRLAARYGKMVFWMDGHWRQPVWLKASLTPHFFKTMKKYPEYFVPITKHNFAFSPLMANSTLMGLELGNVIRQWGVQIESWYYHPWRDRANFRPPMYAQMTLAAVSEGSKVFGYEPPGDLWGDRGGGLKADTGSDPFSRTWSEIMIPLFREIVKQKASPGRKQILDRARVGILAREQNKNNVGGGYVGGGGIKWGSGDFFTIMDGVYGMRHHGEVIPNNGTYYILPILSELLAPDEHPIEDLVTSDQFTSAGEAKKYMDEKYPAPDDARGTGYVTRVGGTYFAIHTQEFPNQNMATVGKRDVREETYEISPDSPHVETIKGTLDLYQYMMVTPMDDSVRIHCGGARSSKPVVRINASEKPDVSVSGPGNVVNKNWTGSQMVLKLNHQHGGVTVVLN